MAITDRMLNALRRVVGEPRAERDKAESPSSDALRSAPASTFAIWGRQDIGGLLSVSQNLMDRFADYEAMKDYPDVACFAGDMRVYVAENSVVTPVPIKMLAVDGFGKKILAFDRKKKQIVKTDAVEPRLTGRNQPILKIHLSNGSALRVTQDHKILTVDKGYVEAKDLKGGDLLIAAAHGFDPTNKSMLTHNNPGSLWVQIDPQVDGVDDVYDITTETHNLIVEGAVCHNSAFHYFANDACQPNLDNGRALWVTSPDEAVVGAADVMLRKRIRLEDELFPMAYTLCQYGQDYEEVLVTPNGVVGLNALAPPTMRRVEKLNGALVGYVQDVTGRFTADQDELRRMLAGNLEIPQHVALFEDWQAIHFRLRSTARRSPYGMSVAEGARWIWKRLVMMEDAVMIYKLCLRGDSQIWTPEGRKAIKDLKEGDEVYSYTTADKLKKTKVVYKKHNGQDTIYRVFSDHRELFANATHPVLVETVESYGKGHPRVRRLDYVEVKDLKPGVHRLVTPKKNEKEWEEIRLKKPNLQTKARLVPVGEVRRNVGLLKLQKSCGDDELKTDTAVALLDANGYSEEHLEVEEHWGGSRGLPVKGVTIPDTADEEFAKWWGFMLGDGFITTRNHKSGHIAQNEVGFTLGTNNTLNDHYKELFERWVSEVKLVNDTGHRLGAYSFTSSKFAEFMLLNGFIPGAHDKRLPEWIFRAHPKLKLAMIRGLADADAHIKPRYISKARKRVRHEVFRFEMCNKALLEDVRELAMQLGLTVTLIRERKRKGGRTIKGSTQPLAPRVSYCMDVTLKPQAPTEVLRGVEEIGTDDIWDIGVEADEHNFVANGVTVHNTRAPSRYAFYVDVTDVASNRVASFLRRQKRDLKKRKMVNPNRNQLDFRYSPLCLSADTKIPLLNGTESSILGMVEAFERGEEQWVYSVDVNDGNKLKPGKVVWAGKTRENTQLIRLTLDNGESIKVTPDHKMIRRSGAFVEAQNLQVGDSLMPFRRRVSDKNHGDTLSGYELVYCPDCKRYVYTHRMVAESVCGKVVGDGNVTHHDDFDKLNNDPRNLKVMPWEDHLELHRRLGHQNSIYEMMKNDAELERRAREGASRAITRYNKSPEKRARTSLQNRERDTAQYIRAFNDETWNDPDLRAEQSARMRVKFPPAFIEGLKALIHENPDLSQKALLRVIPAALVDLLDAANTRTVRKLYPAMLTKAAKAAGADSWAEFHQEAVDDNHKVVKIEWLDGREDTYTLTVDDAHTFAVSAGVFVKNSNDEDFVIAVREGRELSRVEVLSGPDYQNVDDVQYFKRMLHGALMVPRAYLGQDEPIQNRAILSNEDVRAARVTLNVQKELRLGVEHLIRIDMAARGVPNPWAVDFDVNMTVPSGIYELAAMEVKNARADFAARIQPFVSSRWILENVFKFSDGEITEIEKQRKKEARQADSMGMDPSFGQFTGGMPPEPAEQPPEQGAEPGLEPERPEKNAPQAAWRHYNYSRRLMERRDAFSRRNHQQLVDMIGELRQNDARFARQLAETQAFMREFRSAALRPSAYGVSGLPSAGRGRRFARN